MKNNPQPDQKSKNAPNMDWREVVREREAQEIKNQRLKESNSDSSAVTVVLAMLIAVGIGVIIQFNKMGVLYGAIFFGPVLLIADLAAVFLVGSVRGQTSLALIANIAALIVVVMIVLT